MHRHFSHTSTRRYANIRDNLAELVVYSKREEDHEGHVHLVLRALMNAGLYSKLSKCTFSAREIELLGYIVSDKGISIKSRLNTILHWPEPGA
jgi:hypothetical protein